MTSGVTRSLNGQLCPPKTLLRDLSKELPKFEHSRPLRRIHGDLCFNNVLADPLHGTVRLIDPRGERATDPTISLGYGDPRYDLLAAALRRLSLRRRSARLLLLAPDQDVGTTNSWRAHLSHHVATRQLQKYSHNSVEADNLQLQKSGISLQAYFFRCCRFTAIV